MDEKVITENAGEKIRIVSGDTGFALIRHKRTDSSSGFNGGTGYSIIVLNNEEMKEVIRFAHEHGI